MSDLRALTEAFDELERRADDALPHLRADLPRTSARSRTQWVPVAAVGAAVVAGLVTAATLLPREDPATRVDAAQTGTSTPLPTTTTTAARSELPKNPEELAERFRAVLGDMATFTVTSSGPGAYRMTASPPPSAGNVPPQEMSSMGTAVGASIVGTITADGVTGGFDLLLYPSSDPEADAGCAMVDGCTMTRLPDGSSLALGEFRHAEGGGVTYDVMHVRRDGSVFTMHVSNLRNPKGNSESLGGRPPLDLDRLRAIATSDRW